MVLVWVGRAVWKLSDHPHLYYFEECCLKQKCFLTDAAHDETRRLLDVG